MLMIIMSIVILWVVFFMKTFEIMIIMLFTMVLLMMEMTSKNGMTISEFFCLDLMSMLLIILTLWISILMIMASISLNVFKNKKFIFYINLMMFLLFICFSVSNLLMFYFFFESVLFPIIMLIFGWGNQPERLQAGVYMMMYTIFGSFPMLIILIYYFNKMNSLYYPYMEWISSSLGFFFLFMMMGFLVKIPMFLFHLWLPKAHVEAPISGSMILAGILLKLGIYGIFRFKSIFLIDVMNFCEIIMIVSIWGSVMISLYCLYQIDIKSLIAYSSVCHMGVVLSGMLTFSKLSSMGSVLLMIGHGLCSSALFCMANLIYERVFTRSIIMFKGLKTIFPSLVLWWFIFSIINMSAPMTMNLFGELFLSMSILKMSILYFIPISLIVFLSACYSIYLYSYINHGSGWIFWSSSLIKIREFNLLFLHFFPLFVWFLKISLFCEWI
nr:NADH dehydrogenase subunit 4 [Amblyomma maculatum]